MHLPFPSRRSCPKEQVSSDRGDEFDTPVGAGQQTRDTTPPGEIATEHSPLLFFCGDAAGCRDPASIALRQALGYGGGAALVNATCGQPAQVFATLLKGEKYTLPSKAQLMQLPTPKQKPIAFASDANYDPATNRLCAGGWVALYTRFVHPSPNVQGSTNYDPNYGGNLVTSALSGLWTSFQQWVRDLLQSIFDAFVSFGFMITTPKGITYGHAGRSTSQCLDASADQ